MSNCLEFLKTLWIDTQNFEGFKPKAPKVNLPEVISVRISEENSNLFESPRWDAALSTSKIISITSSNKFDVIAIEPIYLVGDILTYCNNPVSFSWIIRDKRNNQTYSEVKFLDNVEGKMRSLCVYLEILE